jgi:hypothetical protein
LNLTDILRQKAKQQSKESSQSAIAATKAKGLHLFFFFSYNKKLFKFFFQIKVLNLHWSEF